MERDRFVVGIPLGRWQTNCFLVGDRALGEAVVVDPGEDVDDAVPALLDELAVRCTAILLTHGHIDHMWAVPSLAERLDVPVFLHPEDRWLWDEPLSAFGPLPAEAAEQFLGGPWRPPTERLADLRDGETLRCAGVELVVQYTPGHTPGHVTFLARGVGDAEVRLVRPVASAADALLAGDLVFQGSVGRTDFPRGSQAELLDSIARVVLPLDDGTLVLPGHGPETTVGHERRTNPFLAELRGV